MHEKELVFCRRRVGGGAAGLMAAIKAARLGCKGLVITDGAYGDPAAYCDLGESGKYYVQIATLAEEENIANLLEKYESK